MDDAKIKNFTSCFKEKKFLVFFFNRLRVNNTGRYEKEFPYFSPCGRESNYVRCDDVPYVFTHVVPDPKDENLFRFCYAHAGDELSVPFEPEKMIMLPRTGRVYHPAPKKVGGIGLVKSSLAIEFSKFFTFGQSEENPPTHFTWNEKTYELVKWYDTLPDDTDDTSGHEKVKES
ncbi:hypothetical protein RUM43_009332 [Polyplax serrata]|uniref:Uncharacterized protein n=1 Tax=Polyplax serrata TaxID=468196 RepID=A0AAN8S4G6_POLSC